MKYLYLLSLTNVCIAATVENKSSNREILQKKPMTHYIVGALILTPLMICTSCVVMRTWHKRRITGINEAAGKAIAKERKPRDEEIRKLEDANEGKVIETWNLRYKTIIDRIANDLSSKSGFSKEQVESKFTNIVNSPDNKKIIQNSSKGCKPGIDVFEARMKSKILITEDEYSKLANMSKEELCKVLGLDSA